MPDPVVTRNAFRTTVTGEQRTGQCENCGTKTEKEFYMDGERRRVRPVCPKCGGMGRLIVKTYSIQPPNPPQCLSFRCLYQFFRDTLFCALLSNYHRRRVAYATGNRNKDILTRYRTGEPSPDTMWEVVHALLKLKCPICNKFNRDPLLFRR